eukprot:6212482-Pleurochrysis_carterae.AAC.3
MHDLVRIHRNGISLFAVAHLFAEHLQLARALPQLEHFEKAQWHKDIGTKQFVQLGVLRDFKRELRLMSVPPMPSWEAIFDEPLAGLSAAECALTLPAVVGASCSEHAVATSSRADCESAPLVAASPAVVTAEAEAAAAAAAAAAAVALLAAIVITALSRARQHRAGSSLGRRRPMSTRCD